MEPSSWKRKSSDDSNGSPKRPCLSEVRRKLEEKQRKLDSLYEEINVEKQDKQNSKKLVHSLLGQILEEVCEQDGGHIYKQIYVDAGSHPIKAKIEKADEFDVNIPMSINIGGLSLDGNVDYKFDIPRGETQASNTSYTRNLEPVRLSGPKIPNGYAVLEVIHRDNKGLAEKQLPDKFLHRSGDTRSSGRHAVINRASSGNIQLIPYDVKCDLHSKLKKLSIPGVTVKSPWHGPAITLKIQPPRNSAVTHSIDLDVTASVMVDKCLDISRFGWPRPESVLAFGRDLIKNATKAGLHLVPKKDLFWAISFSRVERALLSSIDGDHGCRKYVYKLMKNFVRRCASTSEYNYNGMSHSVKTQILWSCEKHCNQSQYWRYENRLWCFVNFVDEYALTLRSGTQQDYFNHSIDILSGKEPEMCHELAEYIQTQFLAMFC